MIKASIYCASTTTVLFFASLFMFGKETHEIDFMLIFVLTFIGGYLWVKSFVLCLILLLPLNHLFKRSSLMFSFLIFIIIGFTLPATGMYIFSSIPFHGETPALYQEDFFKAIMPIVNIGVIGAIGAASAWYILKRDSKENNA